MKIAASPLVLRGPERQIEVFERLAGPECLLELLGLGLGAPVDEEFLENDRPGPNRGSGKPSITS